MPRLGPQGTMLARLRHWIRLSRLNRTSGIRVAASAFIAESAMIQTESDGFAFGGRILISERVIISDGVVIASYGGAIEIAERVYIGPYCVLYGHGGLMIGRNTMIGAHTVIVPANHGYEHVNIPMNMQPLTLKGISIDEDVWIGSGCRILDGVSVAKGAVIGAGSVVTKDIEPYSIALGVPAVAVRSRLGRVATHGPAGIEDAAGTSARI